MNPFHSDERGFISRTILLAIVVFALLGVVIIDGSSILFSKWQLSDVADAAASEAAFAYHNVHTQQAAQDAAMRVLADRDPDAVIKKLTIDQQTGEVKLTLIKDTPTLFVSHIGPLKDLAHTETTSIGKPAPA